MINNSHAWPLIWPFLAGALAIWTSRSDGRVGFGADIGKAAFVGLVAGSVFVIATALALSRMELTEGVGLAGLAFAAVIGLFGAMLGGALVHPIAQRA
jgi:hypothetical protein